MKTLFIVATLLSSSLQAAESATAYVTSAASASQGTVTIFSTYDGTYDENSGYVVSRQNGGPKFHDATGVAFAPTADVTLTQINAALVNRLGAPIVTVAIFNTKNGVPGDLLFRKTTNNIPPSGQCCASVVTRLSRGLPLTAGVTYWVVVYLPKPTENATADEWDTPNTPTSGTLAQHYKKQWLTGQHQLPAVTLYGK